jgi:HEXXH motif-containing protein
MLGHRPGPGGAALGRLAIEPTAAILGVLDASPLSLRSPTQADRTALDSAGDFIAGFPHLLSVVWYHVGAIGVLAINDDDYDQSHSAPELGTTILVSVPSDRRLAPLRVVESVVHEAMHLHLGALEARVPLVRSSGLLHSPWRATARPAGGVLHGLYVFACLRQFFLRFAACRKGGAEEIAHAADRVLQIEAEIAAVDLPALLGHLTPDGVRLVEALV